MRGEGKEEVKKEAMQSSQGATPWLYNNKLVDRQGMLANLNEALHC